MKSRKVKSKCHLLPTFWDLKVSPSYFAFFFGILCPHNSGVFRLFSKVTQKGYFFEGYYGTIRTGLKKGIKDAEVVAARLTAIGLDKIERLDNGDITDSTKNNFVEHFTSFTQSNPVWAKSTDQRSVNSLTMMVTKSSTCFGVSSAPIR